MPDEEYDAGASYLAALRQSSSSACAGAAPARAPDTPPAGVSAPLGKEPASSEKRKSPRYKCSGSVRMQESGSASWAWAMFTDISMHGCYLESAAPYIKGTVLDLKLESNGQRIEALGEVRVSYPGLGMGVSFTRISDADRERLRSLVGSLSPRSVILGPRGVQTGPQVPNILPAVTNPAAAIQAIINFFEGRQMMGRDEFFRVLRKSQL